MKKKENFFLSKKEIISWFQMNRSKIFFITFIVLVTLGWIILVILENGS